MPRDETTKGRSPRQGEKNPAFQFYPKDFLTDIHVQRMRLDERGVYFTLLCHDWLENGLTEQELTDLIELNINGGSHLVRSRFTEHPTRPGYFTNPRLQKEREKQSAWRKKSVEAGRASGKARQLRHLRDEPNSNQNATKAQPNGNSPSPSPSPNNNIYKSAKRTRLKVSQDDIGEAPTDDNPSLPTQLQELFKSQGKTEVYPNIWVKPDWFEKFKAEPRFRNYIDSALDAMHQWSIGLDVSSKTKLPHWVSYRMKRDHQRVLIDQILRIKERERKHDEARA